MAWFLARVFLLIVLLGVFSGCTSIAFNFPDGLLSNALNDEKRFYDCKSGHYVSRIYVGTSANYDFFRSDSRYREFGLYELPISFLMDTVLLPYSLVMQLGYGGYCDGLAKVYLPGERLKVTVGHRFNKSGEILNTAGDEFVYSIILPGNEDWRPANLQRYDAFGSFEAVGTISGELKIQWRWITKEKELLMIENGRSWYDEVHFPWYTEVNVEIGSRYQASAPKRGSSEVVFIQPIYLVSKYYCVRSLSRLRREDSEGVFYVNRLRDVCPFRLVDGRDSFLSFTYPDFLIGESDYVAAEDLVEDWLNLIDVRYSEIWSSLRVMEGAYQF